MTRFTRDIDIILSNLTGIFLVMAAIMTAMAIACVVLGEPWNVYGFLAGFLVSVIVAGFLWVLFPQKKEIELRHAMVVAALAYLIVPAISSVPYIILQGMSPIDAYFESMSGWTGTGLSMILRPEDSSNAVLLWRSVTEWIGGIGVILLMVVILIRPGTSTFILYQSEARKEKIHPSIQSTINTIWKLYAGLTAFGIMLFVVCGMPLWDAINHAMVAIGTGGFSIYFDSIAHYNSPLIEAAVCVMMLLGALPFFVMYHAIRGKIMEFFTDVQVKAFFFIIILLSAGLALENYFHYLGIIDSIRYSVFQLISGITCTGFQTTDMSGWTHTALLIMSIAMIIGGCAGSTAGGIKVARAIFMWDEIGLWIKKTILPKHAIVTIKIGDKRVTEDVINKELAEATLISFLWIIFLVAGVIVLSHVVAPGTDLSKVFFEVCSAQGNVGVTAGITSPTMHTLGKIMLILNMWVGRLEIIPMVLLIRYILKGFRV